MIKILTDSGARYVNSPGVLTDSIITDGNSKDAEGFAEALYRRTIDHQVSSESGIWYLGDTTSGSSRYCIPGEKDIRTTHDDSTSNLLNSESLVKSDLCTDILLNGDYEPGTSA